MFDLLAQLTIGFTIALSGVLLPGPLLAFTAARTLDFGPKAGLYAALGHVSVEILFLFLAGMGLKTLIDKDIFMITTGSAGAILLVAQTLYAAVMLP